MALKPCRECKTEISTDAKTCPHCGKKKPHDSPLQNVIGGIVLFGLVAGGLAWCGGDDETASDAVADKSAEGPITATGLEGCARKAMRGATGVERILKVDIRDSAADPGQKLIDVTFEAADNLTTSFVKGGIEQGMWRGYHAIFTCPEEPVARATMEAQMMLVDKLGNESMGVVYGTELTGAVATKVNWANRDTIDPTAVWKTYRLNRSFRE